MLSVAPKRPIFTQKAITNELRRIKFLDQILAENGALTFEKLYSFCQLQKKGEQQYFKSEAQLEICVKMHENIFYVSENLVRNRMREFREMFGYLTNLISIEGFKQSSLDVVASVLDRFDNIILYEIDPNGEGLRTFIDSFSLLDIDEKNNVKLAPKCFNIPSAWEKKALPTYEPEMRYDTSIETTGIGKVVDTGKSMSIYDVKIIDGRCCGQVFALRTALLKKQCLDAESLTGSVVKVRAVRTYESPYLWSVTYVELFMSENVHLANGHLPKKIEMIQETKKDDIKLTMNRMTVEDKNGSEEEACYSFHRFPSTATAGETEFIQKVLKEETRRIEEVDICLGDYSLRFSDLFDYFVERDTFAYFSQMKKFITIRSHMYETTENFVRKRPEKYRVKMLKFLELVNEKSKNRITVGDLRKFLLHDAEFREKFGQHAETATNFIKFLRDHGTVFELSEAFGEEFISLRGTFFKPLNIFIPRFYFSFNLSTK